MKFRTYIFEDDPGIRHLLSMIALGRGHEVTAFAAPRDCGLFLEPTKLSHPCPDIVLTDYDMPGATGLDLIETLRLTGRIRNFQNLALITADDHPNIRKEAARHGFLLINKPFHPAELSRWLMECEERIRSTAQSAPLSSASFQMV